MNTREYNLWFVFRRAEDVPGEWVGHCLDLDVISQGTTLQHALRMLGEACFMVVRDDVSAGRDPLDRRAPQPSWDSMFNIANHGRPVDFNSLDETKVSFVACQAIFKCVFSGASTRTQVQETPEVAVPLALEATSPTTQSCCC